MRRIILASALAIAFLVVGAPSCQPAEPTMTITAKRTSDCLNQPTVEGVVTPTTATTKVVLQRSSAGKWTDFLWYQTSDTSETRHTITSTVRSRDGGYSLSFVDQNWGDKLSGTQKFRVRSNGGGYVSPSVYFTFPITCA